MRVLVGAEESSCTRLPYPYSDSGAENSSVLDWVLETLLKCLPILLEYCGLSWWTRSSLLAFCFSLVHLSPDHTQGYPFSVFPTYNHQSRRGNVGSLQTQSIITKLRQKNKGEKSLVSQTIGGKGKTRLAKLMACRCSSKQLRHLGEWTHACKLQRAWKEIPFLISDVF